MNGFSVRNKQSGQALIGTLGVVLATFLVTPMAIDAPLYFNVQQQLQTTTEAAALAGANKLVSGSSTAQTDARNEAIRIAQMNPVGGKTLQASDFTFTFQGSSMQVATSYRMPTITTKLLCALTINTRKKSSYGYTQTNNQQAPTIVDCDSLAMKAQARAIPAARDTVLVIDTSSSMDDLGGGRPFSDVKSAANKFLDQVVSLNSESVDRVALVDFNQTARIQNNLTSQQQSPNFSAVRTKITGLRMFSGTGWNTNYESGLKLALDELQANGRANSSKSVIFLTDGMPNTPAPSSYYSYSQNEPYKKCTDIVENSTAVRNLCYRNSRNQLICPKLPSSQITDAMISQTAVNCAMDYTNHMENVTRAQADRAKLMAVQITTIVINDPSKTDNASEIFRRLRKQPSYDPGLLVDYMADTTQGQKYEARTYDAARIAQIYSSIAQEVRIRLATFNNP